MLLVASLLLAIGGIILTPKSGIANAAHLGGILAGAYYVRLIHSRHMAALEVSHPPLRSA